MPKTYAIPNLMFPRFVPGESWHLQQGYMIPIRLPWRLRARPSATLHEIQVRSEERTCSGKFTEGEGARSRSILAEIVGPAP